MHDAERMERKEGAAQEAAGEAAKAFTQAAEAARIAREEQEEMGVIEAEAVEGAAEVTRAQRTAEGEQGAATEAGDAEERVWRDMARKERKQKRRHTAMKLAMAKGDGQRSAGSTDEAGSAQAALPKSTEIEEDCIDNAIQEDADLQVDEWQ